MRLLLDTHALLWWLDGDRRLRAQIRRAIGNKANDVFVSSASVWEITTKARLGKLPGAADVALDVPACVRDQGFSPLAITLRHAQLAGTLAGAHRDPFDRMLAAQSLIEAIPVVSADAAFDSLGAARHW